MAAKKLLKGPQLFALARKTAKKLDINSKGLKLAELICTIQEKEGNQACFKQKKQCLETKCCWQLSCGAKM